MAARGGYSVGLATTFHDPALAIVGPDGDIVFAEATERFLQYKRAFNCEPDPLFRIRELLDEYCPGDLPIKVATTWLRRSSRTTVMGALAALTGVLHPSWIQRWTSDLIQPSLLMRRFELHHMLLGVQSSHMKAGANLALAVRRRLVANRVKWYHYEHHLTHAAMACCTSPFQDAVCVVVDGTGDFGSMTAYHFKDGHLNLIARHRGRESLGALYMLITELCGFSAYQGEEWKVMGLAGYGTCDDNMVQLLRSLVTVDGLNLRYPALPVLRKSIEELHVHRRQPETGPETVAVLASSWQRAFGDIMTALLRNFRALNLSQNLVLAGGCALNSAYAGRVLSDTGFQALHIPAAPADDGAALGAALLAHADQCAFSKNKQHASPFLGTAIRRQDIARLVDYGPTGRVMHFPDSICKEAAACIAGGRIIGWMQGRAEFGPRALGNRSILADPRTMTMQNRINSQVKFRESYRPFAPSILHEHGPAYFDDYQFSPYMERALKFKPEVISQVPAVVHVDGTGRLQSVTKELNPRFCELIVEFHALTGVPLLLNTSFNVMGKPMVHSIEDALGVFYGSGLDALVVGDYMIVK